MESYCSNQNPQSIWIDLSIQVAVKQIQQHKQLILDYRQGEYSHLIGY